MENSVTSNIKLNVTNIKSFLIRSNKKLITLDKKKISLVRKGGEDQKRISLEKQIEKKPKIKIPFLGKLKDTARSIWDRIVTAFSWLLLGFLVTKLPAIIATLKKRLAFVIPIWKGAMKVWKNIAESTKKFYDFIRNPNFGQMSSLLNKHDKDAKAIQKDLDDLGNDLDNIEINEEGEEEDKNVALLNMEQSNQLQNNEQQLPSKRELVDKSKSVMNSVIDSDKPNINLVKILDNEKKDKLNFSISKKSQSGDLNIDLIGEDTFVKTLIQPIIIDKTNPARQNTKMLQSVAIRDSHAGSTGGLS